jgi:hypothetical protein
VTRIKIVRAKVGNLERTANVVSSRLKSSVIKVNKEAKAARIRRGRASSRVDRARGSNPRKVVRKINPVRVSSARINVPIRAMRAHAIVVSRVVVEC